MPEFDCKDFLDLPIVKAEGVNPTVYDDNSIRYDYISIGFNDKNVYIFSSNDTDEIIISEKKPNMIKKNDVEILKSIEGEIFSFNWFGKNAFGYNDLFLISFHNLIPSILFLSVAGKIVVLNISQYK